MKLLLCILDGLGLSNKIEGNAYKLAKTPNLDYLFKTYSSCKLEASGLEVGLPIKQMGNSEVGHTNIGSGRIISQNIQRINEDINNNNFYNNKIILNLIKNIKKNHSKLHLMGLVSDGGVHSSMGHILALIKMCKLKKIEICFHVFTDGRDTLANSSLEYISKIEENLKGIGQIVSVSGRYYAMDRDNRYDRIEEVYDVITGTNNNKYTNIKEAININYKNKITDEFIKPGIINEKGIVTDKDGIIFFNFRPDRLRELGSALSNKSFKGFKRKRVVDIKLVTLMPVSDEVVYKSAYNLINIKNTFGQWIAKNNLKQLRIAETEKYAHVTYFFDGGKELKLKNCKRILVPSPKVTTYDLEPQMSAYKITNILLKEMNNYDVIILNFANGDMVGHTGVLDKTIEAVEVLDDCIGKIYHKVNSLNGLLVITADHGNCEEMLKDKQVITSHTMNKVPFLINRNYQLKDGKLADIAPTLLKLLNIKPPKEMTGDVLIVEDR
ncbi:MAG: 2,3-bisphosphoglycerate-independent phosphoglycerate mutase [Bacilli bacterium]